MKESIYLLETSGVFESLRAYNGKIFKLDEHIDRLFRSARSASIDIKISKEKLKNNLYGRLKKSGLKDAYIRVALRKDGINIIIKPPRLYPENFYKDGIKVVIVATKKNHPNAQSPQIKSEDFLGGVLANLERHNIKKDIPEVILLNKDGLVAEGTISNIFIVKDGIIITPPAYVGILEGITRNCVIDLAEKLKIKVIQIPFTRHQLYNADEVFLTNTSFEVMPVVEVDSRRIKDGKPSILTKKLIKSFRKLTREKKHGQNQTRTNKRI